MSQEIIDKINRYHDAAVEYWARVIDKDVNDVIQLVELDWIKNYVLACVALETSNFRLPGAAPTSVLTKPFNSPELYAEVQAGPLTEDQMRQTLIWLVDRIKESVTQHRTIDNIITVRKKLDAYLNTQQLSSNETKQISQAFKDLTQCYFKPSEQHRKDEDYLSMISYFLDDWDHLLKQDSDEKTQ